MGGPRAEGGRGEETSPQKGSKHARFLAKDEGRRMCQEPPQKGKKTDFCDLGDFQHMLSDPFNNTLRELLGPKGVISQMAL